MKISLYFYSLNSAGGAERMVCMLANFLAERDHHVVLISLDDEKDTCFYFLSPHVNWVKLSRDNSLFGKFKRVIQIRSLFTKNKIQSLVGFVMSGDKTVYLAAKLSGVSIVSAERNSPLMYNLNYSALTRFTIFNTLRLSDLITVQLPGYKSLYPSFLQKKIVVIGNPVPQPKECAQVENADSENYFRIIYVGRLDSVQKRVHLLLQAFMKLANSFPNWKLVLVGDGSEEKELRDEIKRSNLTEQVEMISTTHNVEGIYLNSNLFVMPSLWEGFPNSLAEAMAYGVPAIGFEKASGVSDLISQGGGWLAKGISNASDLSDRMAKAMEDHNGRVLMGKDAKKNMSNYVPDVQLEKWENLLMKQVGKH